MNKNDLFLFFITYNKYINQKNKIKERETLERLKNHSNLMKSQGKQLLPPVKSFNPPSCKHFHQLVLRDELRLLNVRKQKT